MIILDESKNVYVRSGKEYDRVSTVLQATGIINASWYTQDGAMRGTFVHEACALYDLGDLHWDSLDSRLAGYVKGWVRFREDSESRFKIMHIEKKLFCEVNKIAGTADRLGIEGKRPFIIDIKSGDSEFAGIQTMAYESMFPSIDDALFCQKPNRYVVQVNENATYKLKPLTNPADKAIWQSALNVFRFKNPRR